MTSILKIIMHVLKLLRIIFECFTSKPNVYGTFWNVHIKINFKINVSETNRSIELKFCILSILFLWCKIQKPWWNWYLTPVLNFGEVRRVQLAKSTHLHVGALGSFQIFQVCSDAKERVGCGKQREATAPIRSLVEMQPWFLSLRWNTCLWQDCSLGSCTCSEEPTLGKKTLTMMIMIMTTMMLMNT